MRGTSNVPGHPVSELLQTANRATHEALLLHVCCSSNGCGHHRRNDHRSTGTRSSSVPSRPHSRVSGMTDPPALIPLTYRLTSQLRDTGTGSLTFAEGWEKHFPNQGQGLVCQGKRNQSTARGLGLPPRVSYLPNSSSSRYSLPSLST
jgi:hypothetical protein